MNKPITPVYRNIAHARPRGHFARTNRRATSVGGCRRADTRRVVWSRVFVACVAVLGFTRAFAADLPPIEYAVISAALEHGLGNEVERIVIDEYTTGHSVNIADPTRTDAEIALELGTTARAFSEWNRLNREQHALGAALDLDTPHDIMPRAVRSTLFAADDPPTNWAEFRRAFPGAPGILRVSRPGIDDVAGKALLYLEFECGPQCASGRILTLDRGTDDRWRVGAGALVWITAPD